MVHADDPPTSTAAALKVLECRSKLHREIMDALRDTPMTDGELEKLERFNSYGPSTIRKRRSELFQAGKITEAGTRLNDRGFKMIIWRLCG